MQFFETLQEYCNECLQDEDYSVIPGKPIFNLCERRFSVKVDTKQLGNLRKQTGYGLSLCREALLGSNNDINAAQAWLDEQAIKRGWQKAEKLQEKKASDGLIGVMVEDNHAAMVEVCVK